MRLEAIEIRRIAIPLKAPFRTSFGIEQHRDILLVHVITDESEGWGECGAGTEPIFSEDYAEGEHHVIKHYLAPLLLSEPEITSARVSARLYGIQGHRMAKGALEMAIMDAELSAAGISFAQALGSTRDRVDCGVSVSIFDDIGRLLDEVNRFVDEGYKRVKLKIEPGNDIEHVRAVREKFGPDLLLQVDANQAYKLADARHLAKLDEFDLLLIEQPLKKDDLLAHAELAKKLLTPVCLDETITSARVAADALSVGATSVINIKAGRVGGYLEGKKIHDLCEAHGVPVWCGGMLESGVGRAANVALASLPNFTLPGDTSASARYYEEDVTEPFVLKDGQLDVPKGPGLGVAPLPEVLKTITTKTETLTSA